MGFSEMTPSSAQSQRQWLRYKNKSTSVLMDGARPSADSGDQMVRQSACSCKTDTGNCSGHIRSNCVLRRGKGRRVCGGSLRTKVDLGPNRAVDLRSDRAWLEVSSRSSTAVPPNFCRNAAPMCRTNGLPHEHSSTVELLHSASLVVRHNSEQNHRTI